jgi:thioesterase domain-containing protein/NAD(P)-dependent dehydrogenase (short-subunit alcohol dehydrogenase family)/acyl carrier protein
VTFQAAATYLITGGLGGLGLTVARWIVERGGRNLVLIGRSGVSTAEAAAAVEALRVMGARVEVATADVADEAQLAGVLARIRDSMPPLRGVFHAAMALDDDLLTRLDPARFRRVTAAKVDGTWNLHVQTLDCPLDHFVLFSSFATLVGAPGQANYVAANAFMEGLAAHRRSQGLPALAVSWGQLGEVGYVARHPDVAEYLKRVGSTPFSPGEAMEALGLLLGMDVTHAGVMRVDWRRWVQFAGKGRPAQRLRALADVHGAGPEGADASDLRGALQHASADERRAMVREHVRAQAARVLGISPPALATDRPFEELGLDSLMAIELKNQLESDLAVSLPIRELMRVPTVDRLAEAVIRVLSGTETETGEGPGDVAALETPTPSPQGSLVVLRSEGHGPPLFCIHPAGGQVGLYRAMAEALHADRPVYAVQSRLVTGATTEHDSIAGMAEAYAAVIRERQPNGPYHLLGFSFGALVANAAAAVLEGWDERVAFVGVVDCDLRWTDPSYEQDRALQTVIASMYGLLEHEVGVVAPLTHSELGELGGIILGGQAGERTAAVVHWLEERRVLREDVPIAVMSEYVSALLTRVECHLRLIPGVRPTPLRAPIFVWRAQEGLAGHSREAGQWDAFSRAGVVEATLPGTHYAIMAEPLASELGRQVAQRLRAVAGMPTAPAVP